MACRGTSTKHESRCPCPSTIIASCSCSCQRRMQNPARNKNAKTSRVTCPERLCCRDEEVGTYIDKHRIYNEIVPCMYMSLASRCTGNHVCVRKEIRRHSWVFSIAGAGRVTAGGIRKACTDCEKRATGAPMSAEHENIRPTRTDTLRARLEALTGRV